MGEIKQIRGPKKQRQTSAGSEERFVDGSCFPGGGVLEGMWSPPVPAAASLSDGQTPSVKMKFSSLLLLQAPSQIEEEKGEASFSLTLCRSFWKAVCSGGEEG